MRIDSYHFLLTEMKVVVKTLDSKNQELELPNEVKLLISLTPCGRVSICVCVYACYRPLCGS